MQKKERIIKLILDSNIEAAEKQELISALNSNDNKRFLDIILKLVSTIKAIEFILDFFKDN